MKLLPLTADIPGNFTSYIINLRDFKKDLALIFRNQEMKIRY